MQKFTTHPPFSLSFLLIFLFISWFSLELNAQQHTPAQLKKNLIQQEQAREKALKKFNQSGFVTLPKTTKGLDLRTDSLMDEVSHGVYRSGSSLEKSFYFKGFDAQGYPLLYTTTNGGAAIASGVDKLHSSNTSSQTYFGEGITIGVWDGGHISPYHEDLSGRVEHMDNAASVSSHSTHVAGTIAGSGALAESMKISSTQGMAPKATLKSYEYQNKSEIEMLDGAPNLALSNHSYGFLTGVIQSGGEYYFIGNPDEKEDYHNGFYGDFDRTLDIILYYNPNYLQVWAAGNKATDPGLAEGTEHKVWDGEKYIISTQERLKQCYSGYDCIATGSLSKNGITVGAIDKASYNADKASYTIAAFSSRGPADDGRVKPDLVAVGTQMLSTGTKNDYFISQGTSMSSPVVTGSLALVKEAGQKHLQKDLKSSTVKAIAINTANEAGNDGPDYVFGWGVIDTYQAIKIIENNQKGSLIIEDTLNNGATYTQELVANGGILKLTLAWTDVPGTPLTTASLNDRTKMLVNDLDIRVYDESAQVYLPWVLDVENPSSPAQKGDNTIDNVEQIVIPQAEAGKKYRLEITHKGNLVDIDNKNATQSFSVAVTGLANAEIYLSAKSLTQKIDADYFANPGLHLSLIGNRSFEDVSIQYELFDTYTQTVAFSQTVPYTLAVKDEVQTIFLPLNDATFFPVPKRSYKVKVSITHGEDTETRDNFIERDFRYFAEKVITPEEIYVEGFFSDDVILNELKMLSRNMSFGWAGKNAYYTRVSRTKGYAINLVDGTSSVNVIPVQLIGNQAYTFSFWSMSRANDNTGKSFNVRVLAAADEQEIWTGSMDASSLNDSDFQLFSGEFTLPQDGYYLLEIKNANEAETVIDDFSLRFSNSTALIIDYSIDYLNNLHEIPLDLTRVTWSQLNPHIYNAAFEPLTETEQNNLTYRWEVFGADILYEEGTSATDQKPKVRFLGDDKFLGVKLMVNDTYSSSTYLDRRLFKPVFNLVASMYNSLNGNRPEIQYSGYPGFETKKTIFRNSSVGYRRQTLDAMPRSGLESPFFEYNDHVLGVTEDNAYLQPYDRYLVYRFEEAGQYDFVIDILDSASGGTYFNEHQELLRVNVLDQFQPIDNLQIAHTGIVEGTDEVTLTWDNPPLYARKVMTFEKIDPNLFTFEQKKGLSHLNWRIYNGFPRVSPQGTTSILSESIDEASMQHHEVDNWFYLKEPIKGQSQYLTFIETKAYEYPDDTYEVYLLDAATWQGGTPSSQDFIDKGTLVKTEELTGDDYIYLEGFVANINKKKVIDLEALNLNGKAFYLAFSHNTPASANGSFLSIDCIAFENTFKESVKDPILPLIYLNFFNMGEADQGWFSTYSNVYPVEGYEISQLNGQNEPSGDPLGILEEQVANTFTFHLSDLALGTKKVGVKLLYDLSAKEIDKNKYPEGAAHTRIFDEYTPVELTVPVESPLLTTSFLVYPIPATDHVLNVSLNIPEFGNIIYEVYDLSGRKLIDHQAVKTTRIHVERLNVAKLQKGMMYILKVTGPKEVYTKKFTVEP